ALAGGYAVNEQYDLIIVGAGLVGASLAVNLATSPRGGQLSIALVEAGEEPGRFTGAEFDPRVVALTPASQALLEKLDCWQPICAERVCPYRDMEVWDGEGTGRIHFSADDLHNDRLGHIVENSLVSRVLRQRLAELDNITLLRPASVTGLSKPSETGQPVRVTLDNGSQLSSALVVAADGAQSQVRELAGFAVREWAYRQQAIVTNVRT